MITNDIILVPVYRTCCDLQYRQLLTTTIITRLGYNIYRQPFDCTDKY